MLSTVRGYLLIGFAQTLFIRHQASRRDGSGRYLLSSAHHACSRSGSACGACASKRRAIQRREYCFW
ncbi:hypothetical protein DPMN_128647 [Dreissena polymorpha]|uniref:Uncharacterized protein n=1 Tax=Dreissena polymorpha TaxID=45954 RepID=A0A9D4H1M9_DREPO|nr:hypothetical protein DPMN_128647 [Dreissena polymorpha]